MNSFPLPTSTSFSEIQRTKAASPKISTFHRRSSRSRYCLTYAEWITRALLSCKDKCSCLADIYEWMAFNVPGLQEQRFLHSSKGWKNAVRHTLSINPRFRKVKRFGKPALWTLTDDYLRQAEALSKMTNAHVTSSDTQSPPFSDQKSSSDNEHHSNPKHSPENYTSHSVDWSESFFNSATSPSKPPISSVPTVPTANPFRGTCPLPLSMAPFQELARQEYQRIIASLSGREMTASPLANAMLAQPFSAAPKPPTQLLQVATLNGSEASFLLPRPLPIGCLTDHKLLLASLVWPNGPTATY